MQTNRGINFFAPCEGPVDAGLVCQIFAVSGELQQMISPDHQADLINYFFDRPAQMFPVIFRDQFVQHRNLYYEAQTSCLPFSFSLSLECIILAIASDSINYEHGHELEKNAKTLVSTLVELERRTNCETLGSIQACILIGWREAGSAEAGHYSAMAGALAASFGLKFDDPSNSTSDFAMSDDEANTRRLICWGLNVFDR